MSEFIKALQQAERDRNARRDMTGERPPPAPALDVPLPNPPPGARDSRPVEYSNGATYGHEARRLDAPPTPPWRPASVLADQYRALSHFVEERNKKARFSVIGITSAAVREGKTTTVVNLGRALAESGEARVLLIDADFRHPALGRRCGVHDVGFGTLAHALTNDVPLSAVVCRSGSSHVSVIPAGRADRGSYEILRSRRFHELMEEARSRYDYVIVDSPAVLPSPDFRLIGDVVDGFLLVVAANRTPRTTFEDALRELDPAKAVAMVFNGDDTIARGPRQPAGPRAVGRR